MPLSPDDIARIFQIESGGNDRAITGSNRGPAQFSPDLEKKYNITDWTNRDQHAQALQREYDEYAPKLRSVLGRDPTPAEFYLAHQQGLAGATAILSNPDQPAWQSIRPYYNSDRMAQLAVSGNLPKNSGLDANATAGDFAKFWLAKYGGSSPEGNQNTSVATNQPPQGLLPHGGGLMDTATENAALTGTPNTGGLLPPQQQQQQVAGLLPNQQPQMPRPNWMQLPGWNPALS